MIFRVERRLCEILTETKLRTKEEITDLMVLEMINTMKQFIKQKIVYDMYTDTVGITLDIRNINYKDEVEHEEIN